MPLYTNDHDWMVVMLDTQSYSKQGFLSVSMGGEYMAVTSQYYLVIGFPGQCTVAVIAVRDRHCLFVHAFEGKQ